LQSVFAERSPNAGFRRRRRPFTPRITGTAKARQALSKALTASLSRPAARKNRRFS